MLRKTILGAAAAVTLGLAAIAPTSASAGGFSIHLGHGHGHWGHGHWGHGYGYWGGCYKKAVKVFDPHLGHYVWVKKKFCY